MTAMGSCRHLVGAKDGSDDRLFHGPGRADALCRRLCKGGSGLVSHRATKLLDHGVALFQRHLSLAARDVLAQSVAAAQREACLSAKIESHLLSGINWIQMKRPEKALHHFEAAHEVVGVDGKSHVAYPKVMFDLALAHSMLGNIDEALCYASQTWQSCGQNPTY